MPESPPSTPTPVSIVPHTHWDREWYAPFQVYRAQLVHLLDDLLDLLEGDPAARRFLLDGQTSVVDDYLEVRPDAAARLARLVADERLSVGPWMVLMDEFMVSGETIVRDLQLGMARTHELGGKAEVGYLPDMFGHVAQMPQLLRLAGIEHAVVWRGVPAAIDRTAFWWRSPDGSRVRAEYLYGSYSNGRDLPRDPALLVARARGYEAELGDAALVGGGILLMNGSDHLPPQRHLGALVTEANASQRDYEFHIASLAEHVIAQPVDGLDEWSGELRSGARANVLMGVASNRVDVHQLAAGAERALERRAEPLSTLFLAPAEFPHTLLGLAWRNLVLNSAHDSSCACSHDEVVEAVRVRYQEARHIGEALSTDALSMLAARVDTPPSSVVVANPTARPRAGLLSFSVPGPDRLLHLRAVDDGSVHAAQVVDERSGRGLDTVVVGRKIGWVLEMMRGPELAGARITRVERERRADGVEAFTFHEAGPDDPALDLEITREQLHSLGETGATMALRQLRAPVLDLVAHVTDIPGFGWRSFTAVDGPAPDPDPDPDPSEDPKLRRSGGASAPERRNFVGVEPGGQVLENEHLRVEVDPDDGTLTVEADGVRVTGANRYVDGGDGGDTYNYSPPAHDMLVDTPESVRVEVLESGPVRARLLVCARYRWPTHAMGDEHACAARCADTEDAEVNTTLELRAGERFVRVRVDLDHRTRDHRLRAHVPLPTRVDRSDAECAFAVVSRGLTAEGGPHETGLPTFVSRRFVDGSGTSDGSNVAGLALLHDGLLEYEVVGDGTELALTLVRATGYLSRSEPALRPNPAGPLDRLEGPQLQRPLTLEYAILPHRGNWHDGCVPDAADDFLDPLEPVRGGGLRSADLPAVGQVLDVSGARVSALTRDVDGAIVLRGVNLSSDPTTVRVARDGQPVSGEVVDLVGSVTAPFDGSVELRPWEVVTLRLG